VLVRIDDANIDTVEDLFAELRPAQTRVAGTADLHPRRREQEATAILADRPAGYSPRLSGQYQPLACQKALARSAVP
jgi:hypothetical protein